MYINKTGEIKVRIRGIDATIRDLARTDREHREAALRGVMDAARYLMERIKSKFGIYQRTGGSGGGPWEKLTFETNMKKLRKYGFSNKPLIATGGMRDSFYIKEGGEGTLAASVASTDAKLIHHIYGAPRANVPIRDPMLITAIEEQDECRRIIIDELYSAYK